MHLSQIAPEWQLRESLLATVSIKTLRRFVALPLTKTKPKPRLGIGRIIVAKGQMETRLFEERLNTGMLTQPVVREVFCER